MAAPADDLPPGPLIGPSGRTDQFRPFAASAEALAAFPAADRDRLAGARLVVGPSGQVWSLSGRFPELVGATDAAGTRLVPQTWAFTPDQRARLAAYTRADLRPLPLPKYLPAPSAIQKPPAVRAGSRPDGTAIVRPQQPSTTVRRAGRPVGSGDRSKRNAELSRRRAAGASVAELAAAFGITTSSVRFALRAHEKRQQRKAGAVA